MTTFENSKIYFDCPRFTVEEITNKSNNHIFLRKRDAVRVIAIENNSILMVRQYRPIIGKSVLELPGGGIDGFEIPLIAAKRELAEETGRMADSLELAFTFWPLPSITNERIFIFVAKKLAITSQNLEINELDLKVEMIPVASIPSILFNEVTTSADLVALQWLAMQNVT